MGQTLAHGYLTSDELKARKDELRDYYVHTPGWVVREGWAADYVLKHFPKDANILDIGASGGNFLKQLQEKGFTNLSGTDIVDYCTENLPNVDFRACDLNSENLSWGNSTFDVVTALSIAEHLENQFHFCREAHRVLKPGGLFIFSIPNAFHIWSKLSFMLHGDLTDWNDKNAHISFFTSMVFNKIYLRYFTILGKVYENGFLPYFPTVKMPRNEFFGRRVCYFMKKLPEPS